MTEPIQITIWYDTAYGHAAFFLAKRDPLPEVVIQDGRPVDLKYEPFFPPEELTDSTQKAIPLWINWDHVVDVNLSAVGGKPASTEGQRVKMERCIGYKADGTQCRKHATHQWDPACCEAHFKQQKEAVEEQADDEVGRMRTAFIEAFNADVQNEVVVVPSAGLTSGKVFDLILQTGGTTEKLDTLHPEYEPAWKHALTIIRRLMQ